MIPLGPLVRMGYGYVNSIIYTLTLPVMDIVLEKKIIVLTLYHTGTLLYYGWGCHAD